MLASMNIYVLMSLAVKTSMAPCVASPKSQSSNYQNSIRLLLLQPLCHIEEATAAKLVEAAKGKTRLPPLCAALSDTSWPHRGRLVR